MLTYQDIVLLSESKEKEKINLELKSFRTLLPFNESNQKEIAYEIVALANRFGGRLIFGVNDDGRFDGKYSGDIDKLKGQLFNVIQDNISPVVDCDLQFMETEDADFIILYIPKRESIPHAYTDKKGMGIKNRIYYIRTSHGKKLVSDLQLEWMFKSTEDPSYNHTLRIAIELDKKLQLIQGPVPLGNHSINQFFRILNPEQKEAIISDPGLFSSLILELSPFMVLSSISDAYAHSWHIQIKKDYEHIYYGLTPLKYPPKTTPVTLSSLELYGFTTLQGNFPNIFAHLINIFKTPFHLPLGTNLKIYHRERVKSSLIVLTHPDFSIEIDIRLLSSGNGLHPKSTNYEIHTERLKHAYEPWAAENYRYFDAECYISSAFNFPEYDMEEFKTYFEYYSNLKELIHNYWDFEDQQKKMPGRGISALNNKLDEILQRLGN